MQKKCIGLVGETGRMGSILAELIEGDPQYNTLYLKGPGISRRHQDEEDFHRLFQENDLIIDFSHASLIHQVLASGLKSPKPLLLCSTGWDSKEALEKLDQLSKKVAVVVASNTSVGACLQRFLAGKLAKVLGEDYDIDIYESHHRFKQDSPSGTALSLYETVAEAKKELTQKTFPLYTPGEESRPPNQIGMAVERKGNVAGKHTVSFTSLEESLSLTHEAFDRRLFAQGALVAARWLLTPRAPGLYTMFDVLGLTTLV